jgi:hypothetical protein
MAARFLSPENLLKLLELTDKQYRPPQITELTQEIESKTRVEELKN